MDAGHCWLYSPLSGDEPSYNIHCTKRQQGTGTISYLKNKNNPDNAQSMDEKLCYILLVLPGLSLQPWEWAGPHGKGINVCWGQWPQPGKVRNSQEHPGQPGTLLSHSVMSTVTTARNSQEQPGTTMNLCDEHSDHSHEPAVTPLGSGFRDTLARWEIQLRSRDPTCPCLKLGTQDSTMISLHQCRYTGSHILFPSSH